MAAFEQPSTEAELWDVLDRYDTAVPFGGGTDLLVQMRTGKREPECIVDIKRLSTFAEVKNSPEYRCIGAATTCRDVAETFVKESEFQALVGLCKLIGSRQIQNRATLGGNVCNASPAADSAPLLMAMKASYFLVSRDGTRVVPSESFTTNPGRTVLRPRELLKYIGLPPKLVGTGNAFLRVTPRTEMDIAIANVGIQVQVDDTNHCTEARVAIGGVAPTPLLVNEATEVLVGTALEAEALDEFVSRIRRNAEPIDDVRGTRSYRRHVVGVLARRAAITAFERAIASFAAGGN